MKIHSLKVFNADSKKSLKRLKKKLLFLGGSLGIAELGMDSFLKQGRKERLPGGKRNRREDFMCEKRSAEKRAKR